MTARRALGSCGAADAPPDAADGERDDLDLGDFPREAMMPNTADGGDTDAMLAIRANLLRRD